MGALIIDYEAAEIDGQLDLLRDVLARLSDKDGFHEDSPVPEYISLDVFDPHEPNGIRHHGGTIDAGDDLAAVITLRPHRVVD